MKDLSETITDETKKRHLPFETREFLEATFKRNPRPSAGDFSDYSSALDINEEKIRKWFSNKRQKEKQLIISKLN